MITGLNERVEATEAVTYDTLPEGKYDVEVKEIEAWKEKTLKNVEILVRDETGYAVKEGNKTVKEKLAELKVWSCKAKLRITDGEYTNRLIFIDFSTHPDIEFMLSNFLYAVDESSLVLSDLQKKCIGKNLTVDLIHRSYNKTVVDPLTGLDTLIPCISTRIKSYLRPKDLGKAELDI